MDKEELSIKSYHDHFLIIKSKKKDNLAVLAQHIYEKNYHFVDEVIGSEKEVLIKVNESYDEESANKLLTVNLSKKRSCNYYKLPVLFDGKDWDHVCEYLNSSKENLIKTISSVEFEAAMFGFLPGFIYLNHELQWELPRKKNPDKKVKAGTFALGGKYAGIYALESPGGWHSIGTTPLSLYTMEDLPPSQISPTDKIIIESIDEKSYHRLKKQGLTIEEYNLKQ